MRRVCIPIFNTLRLAILTGTVGLFIFKMYSFNCIAYAYAQLLAMFAHDSLFVCNAVFGLRTTKFVNVVKRIGIFLHCCDVSNY